MKSIILSIFILFILITVGHSQDYKHAIGARVGLSSGITYEYNVDQFRGYRGMLSFREGGMQVTGMLQSTRPIYAKFTDKLYYYAGLGAHVGFTRYPPKRGFFSNPFRVPSSGGRFAPVIGLDAIIGLEYRLNRAPISFCLDAKPFLELFGQTIFRFAFFDIGFTMKFTFN